MLHQGTIRHQVLIIMTHYDIIINHHHQVHCHQSEDNGSGEEVFLFSVKVLWFSQKDHFVISFHKCCFKLKLFIIFWSDNEKYTVFTFTMTMTMMLKMWQWQYTVYNTTTMTITMMLMLKDSTRSTIPWQWNDNDSTRSTIPWQWFWWCDNDSTRSMTMRLMMT